MSIGSAIKEARKEKGFTQKELAKKCGISINALCQIELANTHPQKETLKKICEALNISSSYAIIATISDENVKEENRKVFNLLKEAILNLLIK